ncbi:MAG: radical SAM protein [Candidatus Diapherotrites archaeon]|nr:radical SAM protein [Candidatus Diapherotrites archaeon]
MAESKDAGSNLHEATFYKKLDEDKAQCETCNRFCIIKPNEYGDCKVRKNIDGKIYLLVYGKLAAKEIDPIEKKPLFNFKPKSRVYSIATAGCNYHCKFCFPADTAIVSDSGPLFFDELFEKGKNEQVLDDGKVREVDSLQAVTHMARSEDVYHTFSHFYRGPLMKISSFYTPEIKCTPNHEVFVSRDFKNLDKKRADQLTEKDFLVIPRTKSKKSKVVINTKQILESEVLNKTFKTHTKVNKKILNEIQQLSKQGASSKELGMQFGLHPTYVRKLRRRMRDNNPPTVKTKYYLIEEKGKVKISKQKNSGIPLKLELNTDLAELLGFYCAEGHVTTLKGRPNSHSLVFSFSKKELNFAEKVAKNMKLVFGIDAKIITRRTTVTVESKNASLCLFFRNLCGHGAKNKKVPEMLFKADEKAIYAFLRAYVDGDGWIGDGIISTNTVSKKLAYGIYNLFLNLGLLPSFYIWNPPSSKIIEGRKVNQSTLYYVKVQAEHFRKRFIKGDFSNKIKQSENSKRSSKFIETDKYFFIPIHNVGIEQYSGLVYNMEVDKNHSYLANFVSVANCQNYQLSQSFLEQVPYVDCTPEEIVAEAKENGCQGIAYTYTEPTVFFEYAYDTMKLAKKAGLFNVWVSNGYMSEKVSKKILPYLDAINIDLKGTDLFYRKLVGVPSTKPVLDNIKFFYENGVHVEVTNLLITAENDSDASLDFVIRSIKEISEEIPLHFTAYYPAYKMMNPPTQPLTLIKARNKALAAGLKYVYTGNVPAAEGESTFCPNCNTKVVERYDFYNVQDYSKKGKCPKCKKTLPYFVP